MIDIDLLIVKKVLFSWQNLSILIFSVLFTGSSNLNSTKVAIAFSYIYAFIWSTIPLSGWGSYSSESYGISCTLQWNDNRVFITLMCVFCISTPSAVMFFSYTMILLKCRQSNSNMRLWRSGNSKLTRKEAYLIKVGCLLCVRPKNLMFMEQNRTEHISRYSKCVLNNLISLQNGVCNMM